MMEKERCRLCSSDFLTIFFEDNTRKYVSCNVCRIVFVPSAYFLSEEREKAEYDLHHNEINDAGYRKFLMRAVEPVKYYVPPSTRSLIGLDFGCGPTPVLASMLSEAPLCYNMKIYDIFYFPLRENISAEQQYDFITMTEVAEHLAHPLQELTNLWNLLKDNGVLVIMTKRVIGTVESFRNWHYIRDLTHITFFSEQTFQWIKEFWDRKYHNCKMVHFFSKDVVVFQKANTL